MLKKYRKNLLIAAANPINHKLLHKVGKQWIILSISMIACFGLAGFATKYTHADSYPVTETIQHQANHLHQSIINHNLRSQMMIMATKSHHKNSHPEYATAPWHDAGHKGMRLTGSHTYDHVKMNYYSDRHNGNSAGDLLEASGHGLLKQSYLNISNIPQSMSNDNKNSWRLKVDPGLYMNNSSDSFKGSNFIYGFTKQYIPFKSMDLSGLTSNGVESFNNVVSDATNNLKNLNISRLNTKSSSDAIQFSNSDKISDVVVNKNIYNTSEPSDTIIGISDKPMKTVTIPSHYHLFARSDEKGFDGISDSDTTPFLIVGNRGNYYTVFNQKGKTVDSRTHKSFKSELRRGIQPAGTYTITKSNYNPNSKRAKAITRAKNRAIARSQYYYSRPYYLNHMNKQTLKKATSLYLNSHSLKSMKHNYSFRKGLNSDAMLSGDSSSIAINKNYLRNNHYLLGWLINNSGDNINRFYNLKSQIIVLRQYRKSKFNPFIFGRHHNQIDVTGFLLYHHKKLSNNYKNGYADASNSKAFIIKKSMNNKQYRLGWYAGFRQNYKDTLKMHKNTPRNYYSLAKKSLLNRHYKNGIGVSIADSSDKMSDISREEDHEALGLNPPKLTQSDIDFYDISSVSHQAMKKLNHLRHIF